MPNTSEASQLAQLANVLEIYGADRTRWPAADRLVLATLLATNAEAKAAFAEALALDRILDAAPRVSGERERALAQRIIATAGHTTPANVVAFKQRPAPARSFFQRPAAALLAASLMLGVFAGTSGNLTPALDFVADAIGLSDDEPELALANDPVLNSEEAL